MPELEANGVSLAYDVQGDGPPLVMIAGRGMPRSWWTKEDVDPYLDAGYSVVRFDNRGMPPSECPEDPFSLADLVLDAAASLDGLGLRDCVLVGHSMGSLIAQELAVARPDLVRAAALINTIARQPAWARVFHRGMIALFESGAEVPPELLVGTLFGQLYNPGQLADDARVEPWMEEMLSLPPWEDPGRVGQWRAYADYEADLGTLSRIKARCLVIACERDLIMPPPLAREVADAIPDCEYVEIPEAGHWGLELDPSRVNSIVLEFLGRS